MQFQFSIFNWIVDFHQVVFLNSILDFRPLIFSLHRFSIFLHLLLNSQSIFVHLYSRSSIHFRQVGVVQKWADPSHARALLNQCSILECRGGEVSMKRRF